ncbi:MAG: cupin domain-containing protein [Thiomonas sp.]|uniref:JmjC domain-containing protein n=1 Tax=Thiomonas sp. TaxID=2047785 RepID=UPI002A35A9F4|nr:cupin domain-containing protein [Thiomonas sp.]MDY0330183.1 cupin domain-containing protein [Thiomonas sp.]
MNKMSTVRIHWGDHTEARFLREFWQRKPLLLRQAFAGFKPLLTRAQLFALAGHDDVESRLLQREGRRWQLDHGPFTRKQIPAVEQRNWTLLVQGVNLHVDAASDLLRLFRFVPDARLDDLMISWASEGGGVGPHQDAYDVFLLQAAGRRRWRIGPVEDATLQPGKPVKLLAHFTPEEDLILEPGDMLYLPPGWGHDGIAASGDCMTYSVGFRAPPQGELLKEVLWQLAEAQQGGAMYRDPPLRPGTAPALLPQAMVRFAREAFSRLKPDAAFFENVLGVYLTTPKPQVWFEGVAIPAATLRRACRQSGCRLDRRSKMLYTAQAVFINGEAVDAALASSAVLRRLADQQNLSAEQVQSSSKAELAVLADWCAQGWLRPGEDGDSGSK